MKRTTESMPKNGPGMGRPRVRACACEAEAAPFDGSHGAGRGGPARAGEDRRAGSPPPQRVSRGSVRTGASGARSASHGA